jgi:hypothetical protein
LGLNEIVVPPEDLLYEIYVLGDYLYIDQSMKIPVEDIINIQEQSPSRLRVTVGGVPRGVTGGDRRIVNEEL